MRTNREIHDAIIRHQQELEDYIAGANIDIDLISEVASEAWNISRELSETLEQCEARAIKMLHEREKIG
jgi:hypothetical protein